MNFGELIDLSINWCVVFTYPFEKIMLNVDGSFETFATDSQFGMKGHLMFPSKFFHDTPGFF
tara:strand:- start:1 stop:186 length:186 start_codon:yes stop_codon:yes gene_type:complete